MRVERLNARIGTRERHIRHTSLLPFPGRPAACIKRRRATYLVSPVVFSLRPVRLSDADGCVRKGSEERTLIDFKSALGPIQNRRKESFCFCLLILSASTTSPDMDSTGVDESVILGRKPVSLFTFTSMAMRMSVYWSDSSSSSFLDFYFINGLLYVFFFFNAF